MKTFCVLLIFFFSIAGFTQNLEQGICQQLNLVWGILKGYDLEVTGVDQEQINCEEAGQIPSRVRRVNKVSLEQMKIDILFALTALSGTHIQPNAENTYFEYVIPRLKKIEVLQEDHEDFSTCQDSPLPFDFKFSEKSLRLCPKSFTEKFGRADQLASWIVWAARAIEKGPAFEFIDCQNGAFKKQPFCEDKLADRDWTGGPHSYRLRFLIDHLDDGARSPSLALQGSDREQLISEIHNTSKLFFNMLTPDQKSEYSKKSLGRLSYFR